MRLRLLQSQDRRFLVELHLEEGREQHQNREALRPLAMSGDGDFCTGRGAKMELGLGQHVEHAPGYRVYGDNVTRGQRHHILHMAELLLHLVEATVGCNHQVIHFLQFLLNFGLAVHRKVRIPEKRSPERTFGIEVVGGITKGREVIVRYVLLQPRERALLNVDERVPARSRNDQSCSKSLLIGSYAQVTHRRTWFRPVSSTWRIPFRLRRPTSPSLHAPLAHSEKVMAIRIGSADEGSALAFGR